MRIFNADKTRELYNYEVDLEKGRLVADKRFLAHHEAIEPKEAVYGDRIEKLPNGSIQNWRDIVLVPAVEGKEAYDEYEDVQVYIPYTAEELKDKLRAKREPLLTAFDKWEKAVLRGREYDDYAIMQWYKELLDLKESAFAVIPSKIQYYM